MKSVRFPSLHRGCPERSIHLHPNGILSQVHSTANELQRFNDNVTLISKLQDRSLNSISDPNIQDQIDHAIQETSAMMNSLRDQIKSLQAQGGNNDVNKIRREHVSIVRVDEPH